jgi:hypothetical protein
MLDACSMANGAWLEAHDHDLATASQGHGRAMAGLRKPWRGHGHGHEL